MIRETEDKNFIGKVKGRKRYGAKETRTISRSLFMCLVEIDKK